jgi:hypothetical protein
LCGQVVCAPAKSAADLLADAESAFRAARQRNSDAGWLRARLEDFDRILACASNPDLRTRLEEIRQLLIAE